MKTEKTKFALKLALFLLPLFTAFFFVEWRLGQHPTEMDALRKKFEAPKNPTEVVIFGTSHLQEAIDPKELSKPAINAALPIQSLMVSAQLGEKYLSHLPNLKLVILEIAYMSRDYSHIKTYAAPRLFDYARSLGVRGEGDLKEWLDLRYFSRYFALGRIEAFNILSTKKREIASEDTAVLEGMTMNSQGAEKQAKYHESLMLARDGEKNLSALKDYSKKLKAKGVSLVLVRTPATEYYRNAVNPEVMQKVIDDVRSAAEISPSHFHDFFADKRFVEKDFYNVDHLNKDGRDKFVSILNHELISKY